MPAIHCHTIILCFHCKVGTTPFNIFPFVYSLIHNAIHMLERAVYTNYTVGMSATYAHTPHSHAQLTVTHTQHIHAHHCRPAYNFNRIIRPNGMSHKVCQNNTT